jgi:hypothetical protein
MCVRDKFEAEATDSIIDYLEENPEWADFEYREDDLDDYRETMFQHLFNEVAEYVEDIDCRNSVDDNSLWMCQVINYVMERTAEEGEPPRTTCVAMFNLYRYYIGYDLIYDEWNYLLQVYMDRRQDQQNNNEEEETKDENNDQL